MPKQKNNIIMRGTRGMVGKQIVFKTRNGITYVSAPPEVDENRIPTPGQLAIIQRFKTSVAYATGAIKDPAMEEAYSSKARRNQSAYNVAIRDAFTVPEVLGIIAQGYRGEIGDILVVQAIDDFRVKSVRISIHDAANQLIEEGDAVVNADGLNWTYTVTRPNAAVTGSKITATAIDLPGNEGALEITL